MGSLGRVRWLLLAAGTLTVSACVGPAGDAGLALDAASDRVNVLAPIDAAELTTQRTRPRRYAVEIVSGLPSGCAELDRIEVERDGHAIDVTVWNHVPADPEVVCTMIYGMVENTVDLGSDFASGQTYVVRINRDTVLEFTAD